MRTRHLLVACICLAVPLAMGAQETSHTLKKGETLYAIAKDYGVEYDDIIKLNKIEDARKLQAGQKIRIPSSKAWSSYTVASGDTLYGIAHDHGMTVGELRAANGLEEGRVLKVGTVLKVSRKPESTPAVPAIKPTVPVATPATASSVASANPAATPKAGDLRWPIEFRSMSYMQGKLYGVVLDGEKDEPVKSLSDGTVVSAGPYRGFGRVIIVQSEAEYLYVYGGCDTLLVKEGERVSSGASLGLLGTDTKTKKPQLQLMVYKGKKAIDPMNAPRNN